MSAHFSLLSLLFLVLWRYSSSLHLSCLPDEIQSYKFEAQGEFFSMKSNLDPSIEYKQQTLISADVALHCMKAVTTNNKDILIWWMNVENVERSIRTAFLEAPSSTDNSSSVHYLPPLDAKDLDALSGHVFAQGIDGKMFPVLHSSQDETADVSNLKKSILQILQTSIDTGCSKRDLNVGTVQICYKKSYNAQNQEFVMEAVADAKDIKTKAPFVTDLSPKFDQWKYSRKATYDSTGRLTTAMEDILFSKGTASPRVHNVQKDHDLDETQMREIASFVNAHSETSLTLSSTHKKTDKSLSPLFAKLNKSVHTLRSAFGSLASLVDFVQQNAEYSLDQLALSVKNANELGKRFKKQIEQQMDFWALFSTFKTAQPLDEHTFSKMRRYVSIVGVDKTRLFEECYGPLKGQSMEEQQVQDYQLACQALLIADQTEDGQDFLLQSMKLHRKLLDHGLIQCLHLSSPIPGIVRFLVGLQKKDTFSASVNFKLSTSADFDAVKDQTYLVLAGVTRNLPRRRAEQLLRIFLKHLHAAHESGDESRILLVTRALQNIGDLVPWQILHSNALNEANSEEVQQAAAEALCSHTNADQHADVTAALSHIALNAQTHPNVRSAAVLSQLTREQSMSEENHGSARDAFSLLYHNPHVSSQVHASIEQYLHHDATDEAAKIFDSVHDERQSYDANTYDQAVEKIVSSQTSTSNAWNAHVLQYEVSSSEVSDLTQTINQFKTTFDTAIRSNAEQCVQMSANHDQKMCMHDATMVDFVQRIVQTGKLDQTPQTGKHLTYEKYCGVDALNMFSGFVGGVYKSSTNAKDFALFTRSFIHMAFLQKRLSVVSSNMYIINSPSSTPALLEDKLYVRIKDFVLLDTTLLTPKAKDLAAQCARDVENLVQKSWSPLYSFEIGMSFAGTGLLVKGSVDSSFSLSRGIHLCASKALSTIGMEPILSTTGLVSGAVTISENHYINVNGVFTNRMQFSPKIGFLGDKFCAVLDSSTEPLHITAEVTGAGNGWKSTKVMLDKTLQKNKSSTLLKDCDHIHFGSR
eukprot:CAMPEP_0117449786 /NCGR_PEP_ID=MMETSP0759-20121206/8123_1 /TAXON_ID=63605 /ORGANISM="Percolomonas cosmopolitus, Strain WS" /LENGTH=1036 /DNA_ID=CAMNT_0005242269 /DNA_START=1 /DNA_END=3111 /DNA_ORIENTATION=-